MSGTELAATIVWISTAFSDYKMLFERTIGFDNDALHVFVGFGLQIAVALILRKSVANWTPWTVVVVLELINEGNDLLHEVWPEPSMQLGEGFKDVLLTIAIPTFLMLTVRWRPMQFHKA